jgi:hypothetical protein
MFQMPDLSMVSGCGCPECTRCTWFTCRVIASFFDNQILGAMWPYRSPLLERADKMTAVELAAARERYA